MSSPAPLDRNVRQLRVNRRFKALRPLPAQFLTLSVDIQDLSSSGVQIEHSDPMRPGFCGTIRIDAALTGETITMPARCVWSHLSQNVDRSGNFRYRSGLVLIEPSPSSLGALGRLIHSFGTPGQESMDRERQSAADKPQPPSRAPRLMPVAAQQLEQIKAARAYLQAHVEDAQKWYNQAKSSFASAGYGDYTAPYGDEVLAIWEYTGRMISFSTIVQTLEGL